MKHLPRINRFLVAMVAIVLLAVSFVFAKYFPVKSSPPASSLTQRTSGLIGEQPAQEGSSQLGQATQPAGLGAQLAQPAGERRAQNLTNRQTAQLPGPKAVVSPAQRSSSGAPVVEFMDIEKVMPTRATSLRDLDLTRPPTEKELKMAGNLGGPLSPSANAEPSRIQDPVARKKQEADNLEFGIAIQTWNEHRYPEAVRLFKEHLAVSPESPWACESSMHIGCAAHYSGSYDVAAESFDWVLERTQPGTEIYQKTKLRRSILDFVRGRLDDATKGFSEMLATEADPNRRTYGSDWLRQIAMFKADEAALRDCGAKALQYACKLLKMNADNLARIESTPVSSSEGFSALELVELSRRHGLKLVGVWSGNDLAALPLPFIAHYEDQHYVTVCSVLKDHVRVYDPRLGNETALQISEFQSLWSGLALVPETMKADIAHLAPVSEQTLGDTRGGCCGMPNGNEDLGDDDCDKNCGLPGWKINPRNMNMIISDTPIWWQPPYGPPVDFTLVYNSLDSLNNYEPFGEKWSFNFVSYLMELPNSGDMKVQLKDGDGYSVTFTPDGLGTGGYLQPPGEIRTLVKIAPYTYELRSPDGTVRQYGVPPAMQSGTVSLLTSITDRFGTSLNIGHNANGAITEITHEALPNEKWEFFYNTQSLVARIDDPFGRSAHFYYDANGNLISQTDMGNVPYSYTYTNIDALVAYYDETTGEPVAITQSSPLSNGELFINSITTPKGTTAFNIEPADGIYNGVVRYPLPGGDMWTNYRILITDAEGFSEEHHFDGYSAVLRIRDKTQYRPGVTNDEFLNEPMTSYFFTTVSNRSRVRLIDYADGTRSEFYNWHEQSRQPKTILDRKGNYHFCTYNDQGQKLSYDPPVGGTTEWTYEANGADVDKIYRYLGGVKKQVLDFDYTNGVVSQVTDPLGRATSVFYDTRGRLKTVTNMVTNDVQTNSYDDEGGGTGIGWLEEVQLNGNVQSTQVPDEVGRPELVVDSANYALHYTYDNLNRAISVTRPDQSFYRWDWTCCFMEGEGLYDSNGKPIRALTYYHDGLGRRTGVMDHDGRVTSFRYDPLGRMTLLSDPAGKVTRWKYNDIARTITKIHADASTEISEFDPLGNILYFTDTSNVKASYTYDAVGNLKTHAIPGLATVTFTYDDWDRLDTMVDSHGTSDWGYDLANRQTSLTGPNTNISWVYNDPLRKVTRTLNGKQQESIFDALGRLTNVTNPLGTFQHNYVAQTGRIDASLLPNGLTTDYEYHPDTTDNLLAAIIHKTTAGGSVVSRFDYGYDAQRRIDTWTKTQSGSASQWSMGYNAIGELSGVRQTQISTGELTDRWFFDYDAASNRTSNQHGNVVQTAQHNDLNQLTATVGGGKTRFVGQLNEAGKAWVAGAEVTLQSDNSFETNLDLAPGTHTVSVEAEDGSGNHASKQYQIDVQPGTAATFTHDTNGNLLTDGNRTYTWDPRNRLKSATVGGVVYSWEYDGLDRRISEKVNGTLTKRWVWDGLAIVQQLDASGALLKDYYDEGFKDGATSYYYTRDHLGSIREVTSSTGTVVATYDYSPWGKRTQLTGTLTADHGFTGHLTHPETGLVMAPYRAYDADLGRWLSRDPIGENGGMNLYGYVSNDPINLWDPYGMFEIFGIDFSTPGIGAAMWEGGINGFRNGAGGLAEAFTLGNVQGAFGSDPCDDGYRFGRGAGYVSASSLAAAGGVAAWGAAGLPTMSIGGTTGTGGGFHAFYGVTLGGQTTWMHAALAARGGTAIVSQVSPGLAGFSTGANTLTGIPIIAPAAAAAVGVPASNCVSGAVGALMRGWGL